MRRATAGAIAAGDEQTAEAGAEILRAGGTAVDAVVGAAMAAFVVELPLCSPAGAGALLMGHKRDLQLLDFFAVAPGLGGDGPSELDFSAVEVSFGPAVQQFHVGRAAAAVPGAMLGLLEAHRRGGRLPLAEVVAPAVQLARKGYRLSEGIRFIDDILAPILRLTPATAAIHGAEHEIPPAGSQQSNPRLADFLESFGRDPFEALGALHAGLVRDFGPQQGGLITKADLDAYEVVERVPLGFLAAGHFVITNPPPSSGGALIGLGLQVAERLGLGEAPPGSVARLEGVLKILRALSVVRNRGYDDLVREPDAAEQLLDEQNLDGLTAIVNEQPGLEHPLGSTTHISVLDEEGEAASLTMSNGEGCGHSLPDLGVHVNNFLGEEDINPHGFHQWRPGERMTTMMAPSIALRDGEPVLVLGSGGSNRIRSAILQVLVHRLLWGDDLEDCVAAPRLHAEGPHVWFEAPGLTDILAHRLARSCPGATRFEQLNMFFGGVHAVALDNGRLQAAGDPRRGGAVRIVR